MAPRTSLLCHLALACLCLTILGVLAPTNGARCDGDAQKRRGCRIQGGMCLCGYGCHNDYQYPSEPECRKALRGQRDNKCLPNPCHNGGACSQANMVNYPHGYRCRCEGTGFYGQRCENRCPLPGAQLTPGRSFPYECVVI